MNQQCPPIWVILQDSVTFFVRTYDCVGHIYVIYVVLSKYPNHKLQEGVGGNYKHIFTPVNFHTESTHVYIYM